MEVYQNLLQEIQGNWVCKSASNQTLEEILQLEFSLLISENIISTNGNGGQYWPSICNFELVGSVKDGYFYREDGCFMQVKSLADTTLVIELSLKNEEGQLNTYLFSFSKMLE